MTCVADGAGSGMLDLVRSAVATVLEVPAGTLDAPTRLVEDVGADSLAMIEIVEIIEERLRAKGTALRIDDGVLASMQTLGDVASAFVAAAQPSALL